MADETLVEGSEAKGLSLGWRVALGIVAIIIVGFLAYPFVRNQFGASGVASGESQDTLTEPNSTLQANPNTAEDYFKLGNSYYETGQWEQAASAYQQAIALDPNYQAAYANLGVTYYQQQQFDLAVSQYKKALELDANDGEVAYNLGALYVQQALSSSQDGQPNLDLLNQAIDQLNKVIESHPDLAEPHFTLGVAHLTLNQNTEAIEAFEAFLRLDDSSPDSQARQEAEKYLQLLQGQ